MNYESNFFMNLKLLSNLRNLLVQFPAKIKLLPNKHGFFHVLATIIDREIVKMSMSNVRTIFYNNNNYYYYLKRYSICLTPYSKYRDHD